jgi:hypothetical protein
MKALLNSITTLMILFITAPYAAVAKMPQQQDPVNQAVSKYFELTNTLVNSDAMAASKAAGSMRAHLQSIKPANESTGEIIAAINAKLNLLSGSTDLEKQRIYFADISDNLYKLMHEIKPSGALYRQYCPMAFKNKGGYWISDEKEIKNPYFGSKMLKCGKVTETIE